MKKQNRNVFAYVRQPNLQQNQEPTNGLKSNKQLSGSNMFNEIVGQMDQNLTKYLNKLVTTNQKQQQKKKSIQKSVNHERTKSYADIMVQTPSNSKNIGEKGHNYRGSHPSTQINNIFFSLNNSPTNQQKPIQIKDKKKGMDRRNNQKYSFLSTLDTYITDLSMNNTPSNQKIDINLDEGNNKFVHKTRQNSANNLKIIQKLETSMKRQKQLRIANQILMAENQKLKNKFKKNKNIVKTTMQNLYQYAQSLSDQLKQEKAERKKLQKFMSQFQSKFNLLRPERKTSGPRPRIEDYLFSQTTDQDEVQPQPCPSEQRSKSIKRRKIAPRSTAKNSRVSGFNIEQLSAMFASKNYEYENQSQQSQNSQA